MFKTTEKKKVESQKNKFLKLYGENENFNQYWFSEKTIEFILNQIVKQNPKKIAFVSTPSLFFSASDEIKEKSVLFDYDEVFLKKHKNVSLFNYLDFDETAEKYKNEFDFVVIDPPFINEEAWEKFAKFARLISLKNDEDGIASKILTCSILENEDFLKKFLDLQLKTFKPLVPHLVYQYNFYANYDDEELNMINEEVGF